VKNFGKSESRANTKHAERRRESKESRLLNQCRVGRWYSVSCIRRGQSTLLQGLHWNPCCVFQAASLELHRLFSDWRLWWLPEEPVGAEGRKGQAGVLLGQRETRQCVGFLCSPGRAPRGAPSSDRWPKRVIVSVFVEYCLQITLESRSWGWLVVKPVHRPACKRRRPLWKRAFLWARPVWEGASSWCER
jgi:hypothetical protein